MRTLAIKNFHEVIEAGLLLEEIRGRGFGGFFFQSEMHAFTSSSLFSESPISWDIIVSGKTLCAEEWRSEVFPRKHRAPPIPVM
jgi:hypothetical protein